MTAAIQNSQAAGSGESSDSTPQNDADLNSGMVPAGLVQVLAESQYYSPYALVVDKKKRSLSVWAQEATGPKRIATYPADLGKKEGEKQTHGDSRTPSGIYFLHEMLEGSGLDFNLYGKRAFTTDYPNFFDRRDGKTGSGIWLHAVPDTVALTRGSRGCVVVRNNVILEISKYVRIKKTPLIIEDETEWIRPSSLSLESGMARASLEAWRKSWESKDIEQYIKHYADDFHALGMNKEQWKAYKAKLNETYQRLEIKLSNPVVYTYKGHAVARFLQSYTSDGHADFGEKTLYMQKVGDEYQIIGEEWQADNSQVALDEFSRHGASALGACQGANCAAATEQAVE